MKVTRALSLQQPSATAICVGVKRVENRSWSNSYRGPIAIHAGANKGRLNRLFKKPVEGVDLAVFPVGAIIGIAELVDIVTMNRELESDPGACGPFCWVLENPQMFREPIPLKGKLQLFNLTSETTETIADRLKSTLSVGDAATEFIRFQYVHDDDEMKNQWAIWRMQSYIDLNQLDDALRCAEQLIETSPRDSYGWRCRGWLHVQAGDPARARADYDAAVSVDSKDAVALWWRADLHEVQGNAGEAALDRKQAIEIEPGIEELVNGKGKNGDSEE